MKIVSWNINGFRSILKKYTLEDLIRQEDPDIILLQEVKISEAGMLDLPAHTTNFLRGDYVWLIDGSVLPGKHGVAAFIKTDLFDSGRFVDREGLDPYVDGSPEGRLQMFIVDDILLLHTYTVNVRQDLSRIPQRDQYDAYIYDLMRQWKEAGYSKIILIGDLNVVSEPIDYHGGVINSTLAGMTDSERNWFKDFLHGQDLVDSFRELHPDEVKYSYWSYRGYARDTDKGWRIDYALVSKELMQSVTRSDILTNVKGSDHAPIVLELE